MEPVVPAPARIRALIALALIGAAAPAAHAGVLAYCDAPTALDATQQDRMLRFAAVIKDELEASGASLALVARSGLDLERWGQRYSHAGISLRASPNGPWSVRQLYYDCDQARPRLFDQGIAGFVLGAADPGQGRVSAVLMPPDLAGPVEAAALDRPAALGLVGDAYSANAFPFATRYQNCNQWVAELLALAWGDAGDGRAAAPAAASDDSAATASASSSAAAREAATVGVRRQAQRWLRDQGYEPASFDLGDPLLAWLAGQLPWLHTDDHPPADLEQWRLRVSMPASIEAFVRARAESAQRIEFCHDTRRIVVHRGWSPLGAECMPAPGDRVVTLD